jgi:hypothetical protein
MIEREDECNLLGNEIKSMIHDPSHMNYKKRKVISRFYAIYLMISVMFLGYAFISIGIFRLLSALIPACFTLAVFLFFFFTGLNFYKNDKGKVNILCVEVCLAIQSFQLEVFGFQLKNYYGPYLAIGFTDTPVFRIIVKHELFRFWISDGYASGRAISLLVNCFPLLLLILFGVFKKRLHAKEYDTFLK